jgi:hypothetical protein
MLRSWWRGAFVAVLFLLVASCTGGGCASGCSSCGITPIPGGFNPASTIPNAASVRVTKPGLEFLSTNLPSLASTLLPRGQTLGEIDVDVPTSMTSYPVTVLGITVITVNLTVCPNGANTMATPPTCEAEIELGNAALAINAVTPHGIQLTGTIPVKLRDLPIETNVGQIDVAIGSNLVCNAGGGSDADYLAVPLTIDLPFVADTNAPRTGYTKIDVANAVVNVGLQQSDIQLCSNCTSVISGVCNDVLGFVTGLVFTPLQQQLSAQIQSELSTRLCTAANAALNPPCPTGSQPASPVMPLGDGGAPATEPNCVYDTDPTTCLPLELGLEGHMNLASALASLSPGTTGALDFAFAAGGDLNPAPGADAGDDGSTPNGLSIGVLGGTLPSPQSDCVPVALNPPPSGLVVPDQMRKDTVPNWPAGDDGPDMGLAIDGQYLNYALASAYNSGLLCLGITTEKYPQLNTGLVSVLVPSIATLTFEQKAAAIAITTRPQKPPVATLGGGTNLTSDPLLSILLPSFALDFYVWSEDRYVRAFTFTADVTVPVNLQTGTSASNPSGGLVPTLGMLSVAKAQVTNNQLLTDDPASIASALSGILGSLVGQLVGSAIPPIDLSSALSSLGLTLTIPSAGIQKITQGSENYLGIFGDLGLPTSMPQVDTQATLLGKTVHPEAMTLTAYDPALAPSLHVSLDSSAAPADTGPGSVEYAWQIDQGTWSPWTTERDVTIRDPMLFLQAKHTLAVTSRLAGQILTEDPTPATVPFTIDVLPPVVTVKQGDLGYSIDAWDVVSPTSALVGRTRPTDANGKQGEWTAWQPVAAIATVAPSLSSIDVEVRDEEGNVGSVSSQLIRGNPDPTLPASGGCTQGCTAASRTDAGWPAIALAGAGIAALLARRTRRLRRAGAGGAALALGSIVALAASSEGCSCGSGNGAAPTKPHDAGGAVCGMGCDQPCGPPLPQGLIGAYTSIAQAADGTLWVAGYNDSAVAPDLGINAVYGDLVVGPYDTGTQSVAWTTVDGLPPPLPDDVCPPDDPSGWRGGLLDPGPDVGLWTSLALDANGHPMVSYYDATNQAVKFASSVDGKTWSTHAIYANVGSDVGRYAKMVLVDGLPVVAFLVVGPGTGGYSQSKVTLAHAKVAVPRSASDWSLEDAVVDNETPCREKDCMANQACVTAPGLTSTGTCVAVSSGCDAACGSGEACIDVANVPSCEAVAAASDIATYPEAVGDYIALGVSADHPVLVVYDRIHGNLLGLSSVNGSWTETILDGETGSRSAGTAVDTGDDGVGASLFVAANGDWHVSYVDGITETLKYLYVPGGTLSNSLAPQIVDDGSQADGKTFSDGLHIVGDDSSVRVNSDGSVSITYMDATAGALRLATGSQTGTTWSLHAIAQPNRFAGFFPHFEPQSANIANWWRWADPTTQAITGDVALVSPN